eukprot:jgi/Botrbrau1/2428/Bobra.0395s0050.1
MDSCRSVSSTGMDLPSRCPLTSTCLRVRLHRSRQMAFISDTVCWKKRAQQYPRGRGRSCLAVVRTRATALGGGWAEFNGPGLSAVDGEGLRSFDGDVMRAAVLWDIGEGLEAPVQLLYLSVLLGFLVVGVYLIIRQVLIRRELEEAAKVLGERIRTGRATPEDCFELGAILLRKKLYTAATKNLERARREWEGEPEELAQIHNALGYAYLQMNRTDFAIDNFSKAVELQPGYVIASNNLGDAYEKAREYEKALQAYEGTLAVAPDNKVAQGRVEALRGRVQRLGS